MPSMIVLFTAQALPEGRVFGLDFQTMSGIVIQLLNGIILAAALSFILYRPVKDFMRQRTDRIRSKLDDAEVTTAKANELIAEYQRKMEEIDKERAEILAAARLKADDESKIILENARQEANQIKESTLASIAEEKKRLQEETRLYIIELASLMAEKYLTENIDADNHEKLFEETIAQLENAQWQN